MTPKRYVTLFGFEFGVVDGALWVRYGFDKYGEAWSLLKIGGAPMQPWSCSHEHDCCGCSFSNGIRVGLFGLWSRTRVLINV